MAITLATPIDEIELAPGSAIRLKDVSWERYLLLLEELGESRATRLMFCDGVVEIRMPGQLHEAINRVLAAIIATLAEVLDLEFNNLGSARLNRTDLAKGIEPDSCFYIQQAQAGQGMVMETDLPPDLAVEVDIASGSAQKLAIYAAMGVSEIWLYRQGQLSIQVLQAEGGYGEAEQSVAFPVVSVALLNEWLELRKTGTDLTVIRAVRSALTPNPSPEGEGL
ncbi:Uma2 family endonuclease [Lyngbya confervoides]|uniref:Uma2 family endonuclease n=1 Tax=Lyngbya confervoides BDU141951 TaxID=1574623 RepID=A0ABD4T7Z8_9CYAN|nr:Uma2 family endonuclease [Lyngbya confervoides]MCM1984644.1 Uma2 family endonuclease [Lyngbya confervoides BDU141951]